MKKTLSVTLLFSLIFALCQSVNAWELLAEDEAAAMYIDPNSIRIHQDNKNLRSFSMLYNKINPRTSVATESSVGTFTINCAGKSFRMEQMSEYSLGDGKGSIIETFLGDPEFEPLEDTWLDRKIYDYLCK